LYLTELHYHPGNLFFSRALAAGGLLLETRENYQKQSYRNRCEIVTAQGIKSLIVPVQHAAPNQLITEVKTDDSQRWAITHWRTICSAYGNSPYFEYYQDQIRQIYNKLPNRLFEMNLKLLETYLRLLRLELPIKFTESYLTLPPADCVDGREKLHPKRLPDNMFGEPYVQVIGSQFAPRLSILDLLFNLGPEASVYLIRASRSETEPGLK